MADERISVEWTEAGIKALAATREREQFTDPETGMVLC